MCEKKYVTRERGSPEEEPGDALLGDGEKGASSKAEQ